MISKLNLKEKTFFYSLVFIFFAGLLGWGIMFYYSKTIAVPTIGGEYIEGIVGQPQHLNPVISPSNTTDEDMVQLIYSSLLKYDNNGKLQNDLAESYEISEDKTTYTFHLRQGVLWHDNTPLTAQDVVFTTNLITDPSYKSPLRANWNGIETTLIDDNTISFKITDPYVGFLNNLTFGILPKHLWENVGPEKFPLTDLNLSPIGSGPYKFSSIQKDSTGNIISYKLIANPNYYDKKPYISKITFNFYSDSDQILEAYNTKEIMGISSIAPQKVAQIKKLQSTNLHKINVPRYFAVFFNQTKSAALAYDEVRQALAYATNRNELVTQVLGGNGKAIYSPILPGMVGATDDINKFDFDIDKANKLLDEKGWTKGEDGIRAKGKTKIEFNLVTIDLPEMVQTAELLKKQWETIGVQVNISSFSIVDIQQNYLRPREYDALLFGQVLGADSDPYSFWHSLMKKDPGLNLALFGTDETDKLITNGRVEFDETKRASIYQEFQKKLAEEVPAIFLYSPIYLYPVNKSVQGNDIQTLPAPSRRFSNVEHWYIKTKRIWK